MKHNSCPCRSVSGRWQWLQIQNPPPSPCAEYGADVRGGRWRPCIEKNKIQLNCTIVEFMMVSTNDTNEALRRSVGLTDGKRKEKSEATGNCHGRQGWESGGKSVFLFRLSNGRWPRPPRFVVLLCSRSKDERTYLEVAMVGPDRARAATARALLVHFLFIHDAKREMEGARRN